MQNKTLITATRAGFASFEMYVHQLKLEGIDVALGRFNRLSKNDGALNAIFRTVHKSKSIGMGFNPFTMMIMKT